MNRFNPFSDTRQPLRWFCTGIIACGFLAGCATSSSFDQAVELKPGYSPNNVFQYTPVLPYDLKRVAVLPLACDQNRTDLLDGCAVMAPILQAELIKTKKFEVVPATREVLRSRTGHSTWTGAEILPSTFFDSLRDAYGCDGVLFCQITVFRPYPPLAIGWRMRLVDSRTRQTLWATDEILDAEHQTLPKDPMFYSLIEPYVEGDSHRGWPLLNSPREFGQYAAAQILATLPAR